jgi:DNA-directed RNA polymerase alpha subunit
MAGPATGADYAVFSRILAVSPFRDRCFKERTVEALVQHGIDAPERLLFMSTEQLRTIPGIGKAALAEIAAYRAKFIPPTTASKEGAGA